MAETKRLLISFAHPDDESFGMAGSIARYVEEGVEVYYICSTNGDVGTIAPEHMEGYSSVKERRLAELACAAQVLGLKEVFTLGYRDSGMPGTVDNLHPESLVSADLEEAAGKIASIIRKVRPQVVVTFDPFGGYGHPDHIRMYEATTRAFQSAGDPSYTNENLDPAVAPYKSQKLYYHTFGRGWMAWLVRLLPLFGQNPREFGKNRDIDLLEIAEHTYPIHTRISTTRFKEIIKRAHECHASQLDDNRNGIVRFIWDILTPSGDTYMLAYPAQTTRRPLERDLFEGVTT